MAHLPAGRTVVHVASIRDPPVHHALAAPGGPPGDAPGSPWWPPLVAPWSRVPAAGTTGASPRLSPAARHRERAGQSSPAPGRIAAASFDRAIGWLNTEPWAIEDLQRKVVLAGSGTDTCINWIRLGLPAAAKSTAPAPTSGQTGYVAAMRRRSSAALYAGLPGLGGRGRLLAPGSGPA